MPPYFIARKAGMQKVQHSMHRDLTIRPWVYNVGLGTTVTVASTAWKENSISYMARVNYHL